MRRGLVALRTEIEQLKAGNEQLHELVICAGCHSDQRVCEIVGNEACYPKAFPRWQSAGGGANLFLHSHWVAITLYRSSCSMLRCRSPATLSPRSHGDVR